MKRALILLLLSMDTRVMLFAQATETPVAKNGALHVSGNEILNEHGTEPQLRGISFSWSLWGGRKYFNPSVVDWLAKDFKASILRVAMGCAVKAHLLLRIYCIAIDSCRLILSDRG